ncbi:hypothetical protein QYE76_038007 [Lolium multiflorum]|uniref:CCHC-type domain-containing protein n=1 Tax=Lolium multiflorum TaxID=4521 RepID=A0AAD8T8E8_LOLMU|nr:hypothetical protein QYE76_038007 [Lolium multiflorum]
MVGSKPPPPKRDASAGKKKPTDATVSGSKSPTRSAARSPSRSPARRGRSQHHGRELVVREKVAREVTGSQWPTLTRTNYADWAVLMRVQLQVHGLWDSMNEDECEEHEDRAALSALLRAVPPELVRTLAAKDNAKAAWDMLRTMRVGAERVRDAKAQTCRRGYDRLTFKEGENVEEFAMHFTTILADLEILGDLEDKRKADRKFLCVPPHKYRQMASSIESLLDLKQRSVEELCGRLLGVEENDALDSEGGSEQLLLTEEEWRSRQKQRATHDAGGRSSGGENHQGRNRGKGRDDRRPARDAGGAKRDDVCRYCGNKSHWGRDCRKKDHEEEAHLAKEDDDADPAMLLVPVVEQSCAFFVELC